MKKELSTYWGLAKPYRGPLYRSGRWLNYFGLFFNPLLWLFLPRFITGVDNREKRRSSLKKNQNNLVSGQIGTNDLGVVYLKLGM